jgi:polyferredoxin
MMAKRLSQRFKRYNSGRTLLQLVSFLLFLFLTVNDRIQFWFILFAGVGLVGSLFFGRIYCHAFCPIAAVMRFESWVYAKLGIRRMKTPTFMRSTLFRWGVLIVFAALMVLTKRSGVEIPLLPAVVVLAFLVSLFFEELLWHRSLCPFGTLLSVTSKRSPRGFAIDSEACIDCGLCEKSCPTEAVSHGDSTRIIDQRECIGCLECVKVCPVDAVSYTAAR